MKEPNTLQELLALRKLTRSVAELVRAQLRQYLTALAPLFRPRNVLGDHIQGGSKEPVKGADQAFKDLQGIYLALAGSSPYDLPKELKSPLERVGWTIELAPLEFTHTASAGGVSKTVTVVSPLKALLVYTGHTQRRVRELLQDRIRAGDDLRQCVLHHAVLHIVVSKQPGLTQLLDALHFPVTTERFAGLGELPITLISSSISTFRPRDDLVIESTDLAGADTFEEVVNVDDILDLKDPLRERLLDLVKSQAPDQVPR